MIASAPGAGRAPMRGRLLLALAKREAAVRTSGTLLGGAWMLLQPALQVGLFWYLLGVVMRVQVPGPVSFASYFITGMLPWMLLCEVLTRNFSVLREFSALFRRAVFPIDILPLLPLLMSAASYGTVFIATASVLGGPRGMAAAAAFTGLLCLWLIPFCYLVSLLGLLVQDSAHAAPTFFSVVLYSTPILYHPAMLPEALKPWLFLNPVADIMALDHAMLQGMPFTAGNLLRPAGLWLLAAVLARRIFLRTEPRIRELL